MCERGSAKSLYSRNQHIEKEGFTAVTTLIKWLRISIYDLIGIQPVCSFVGENSSREFIYHIKPEKSCYQDYYQHAYQNYFFVFHLVVENLANLGYTKPHMKIEFLKKLSELRKH